MQGFQEIIGHESIKSHLQNAIKVGKVSHAYIFHGEEGMGKKMLASALARTLQCDEGGIEPCNHCKACMQSATGNHPDIRWVTHEKASIGVDDIRIQLNNDIQIKPFDSNHKIYIIDDADLLTEQAQNALLKTLEEPPEYGIILLLVKNINRILSTILSRCVVLNLKPIDKNRIIEYLMKEKQVPEYRAEVAADFASGNLGKAIRYGTSEEFEQKKEEILHILRHINEMELSEIIAGLKTISEKKNSIEDYLDFMMLWIRDILMLKATNNPNLLIYKNEYPFLKKQASSRTYEEIDHMISAVEQAKVRLKANVNFDITMELMLLTIKEKRNG